MSNLVLTSIVIGQIETKQICIYSAARLLRGAQMSHGAVMYSQDMGPHHPQECMDDVQETQAHTCS